MHLLFFKKEHWSEGRGLKQPSKFTALQRFRFTRRFIKPVTRLFQAVYGTHKQQYLHQLHARLRAKRAALRVRSLSAEAAETFSTTGLVALSGVGPKSATKLRHRRPRKYPSRVRRRLRRRRRTRR
jgi:hypothetical protein